MKGKLLERALALGLILCVACTLTGTVAASEDLPSRVLRLHVLANSDTKQDQAVKLQVRDRILQCSSQWFANANTRQEAEAAAAAHLSDIRDQAKAALRAAGSRDSVTVMLEDTWFPTRQYGQVTLPAGTYRALRVVIGKGAGHNWWCVLFPALCLPVAQPTKTLEDVLTLPEQKLTESPYRVQFKSVELYESLQNWLKTGTFS